MVTHRQNILHYSPQQFLMSGDHFFYLGQNLLVAALLIIE